MSFLGPEFEMQHIQIWVFIVNELSIRITHTTGSDNKIHTSSQKNEMGTQTEANVWLSWLSFQLTLG